MDGRRAEVAGTRGSDRPAAFTSAVRTVRTGPGVAGRPRGSTGGRRRNFKVGGLAAPVAMSGGRSAPDVADLLGRAPIFAALSERQLKTLAKTAKVVGYPANTRIVKEGEPGIGLYLLLSGAAEVRRGERTLAKLAAGQFFGEMTLLDEQPRSADVVAVQPSECAVLSRWEFWGFAKGEPEVLQSVLKEMARRLRDSNRALTE